jgi:hypothetical protein
MSDETFENDPFSANTQQPQGGDIVFDDDVITEEEFDQLCSNGVPAGRYRFKVTSHTRTAPTDEKPGGDRFSLQVVEAFDTDNPPPGGYNLQDLSFMKFANPTAGQATAMTIARKNMGRFFKACGVEVSGSMNVLQACKAVVGMEVLATVTEREAKGEVYKDLKNFRPVEG